MIRKIRLTVFIFSIAKFFDCKFIFKLSSWKRLFFQTSCSNWKYCKLGAKTFFPNLLMIFQQHSITGSNIWNCYFSDSLFFTWVMIKWRSATAAISTNLFFVLAMTPNCANTIHNIKTRTRLWRDPSLRTFAIHKR